MDKHNNELHHYGVLGMRWGVRRGNASGAYSKGVRKLKKIERTADKLMKKSDKAAYKSAKKYATGKDDEGARAYDAEARKYKYQATKKLQKGKKFYKKMEKEFANIKVSDLNPEDVDYAKRYANKVLT